MGVLVEKVIVSGWGLNEDYKDGEKIVPVLHCTDNLRLQDHDECKAKSRPNLTDTQLCVTPNSPNVAADACKGDSGSSLTQQDNQGNSFIFGIIFYGSNCTETPAKDPRVYTSVSVFIDWIYKHTEIEYTFSNHFYPARYLFNFRK